MKPPTQPTITRDEAEKAAELFGLQLAALTDPTPVLKAFRLSIRAAHPDTGATPDEAAELIDSARDARLVLIRWIDQLPATSCAQCGGTGHVNVGKWSARPCSRCV